jgi:hypothetical protein
MEDTVEYKIIIDGIVEVQGSGGKIQATREALHYFSQYQDDGRKVKLIIEVHNFTNKGE